MARGGRLGAGRAADPALARSASPVIDLVAAAQRPDGYLNTFVQLSGRADFSDLQWGHELYCVGHLAQAAVAWRRAVGDDRLLTVATRAVERMDRELGPGGRAGVDGHPVIEMALVELYRVTGQQRHLDLARQLYLDCGGVDVAVETGDAGLLQAVIGRWDDMRATRTYLTGGVGSLYRDEAFGAPFELPPDRAYTETCAAVGSVMLAWRSLLATGEERFADAIERALLDGVLPGLSLDGTAFYYMNPRHRRPTAPPDVAAGRRR